jgi:glycosyltransferase involved in cell wall biosynthesis
VNDRRPTYSIVIPTYNRPDQLRRCLEGIAALETAKDRFEVVVVDDGSRMPMDEVVEGVLNDLGQHLRIRLMRQENQGPATARNAGAGLAEGNYLVFIDDDCVPEPGWLKRIGQHLAGAPLAGVGGGATDRIGSLYTTAHQALMDYLYATRNADPKQARFCATNNLCLPRELFIELGGMATSFRYAAGEDRDLCDRWRAAGHTLHYLSEARVDHYHALNLTQFLRLHYRYGRGAHHYRAVSRTAAGFEPAGFYAGLVSWPFRTLPPLRASGVFALQVLSQVAHGAGYLRQALAG